MAGPIHAPHPGEGLRAEWARQVTDSCNAISMHGCDGMLLRDGAGAFGRVPPPPNLRDRRGGARFANPDLGCWRIVERIREEDRTDETVKKTYPSLDNRYYSVGETLRHMDEDIPIDLNDFINQGALQDKSVYTDGDKPYIALKIPARPDYTGEWPEAEVVAFTDLDELTTAQKDTAYIVRPLYKLSHYGKVVVDFRLMPALQMVEVL